MAELYIQVITCVQNVTNTIFRCRKILKWQTRFSKRFNDNFFKKKIRMNIYADTKKNLKQNQITYALTQTKL